MSKAQTKQLLFVGLVVLVVYIGYTKYRQKG